MSKGYIYIIEKEPNLCKIGITKNFPNFRNQQLSHEYKQKLRIRGCCIVEDIRKDEKFIHYLLSDYRVYGEWFSLSYEEISNGLKYLFKFQEYDEKNIPSIGYRHKLTIYLDEDLIKEFNEICSKKLIENGKPDKSALISKAVKLLIEDERRKR